MRGFMRRSGTFWFLGTWLGLSALPLIAHGADQRMKPDPLTATCSCPEILTAQRSAAGTRTPAVRETPPDPDTPIEIDSASIEGGVKEGSVLHLKDNVVIRQG